MKPINIYTITFDSDGGSDIDAINKKYLSIIDLPTPTKFDYAFIGWTYLGEVLELPCRYTFEKDITLVANWEGLSDGIEFRIENDEAIITKYVGNEEELVLPSTISGCPITKVASQAFKDNETLKYIKLGEYISEIGDEAFNNMIMLENIEFSNATQIFGTLVFDIQIS